MCHKELQFLKAFSVVTISQENPGTASAAWRQSQFTLGFPLPTPTLHTHITIGSQFFIAFRDTRRNRRRSIRHHAQGDDSKLFFACYVTLMLNDTHLAVGRVIRRGTAGPDLRAIQTPYVRMTNGLVESVVLVATSGIIMALALGAYICIPHNC